MASLVQEDLAKEDTEKMNLAQKKEKENKDKGKE